MLNRGLLFKRGSGLVGWVAFPFFLIFEWIGPFIEVAGYIFVAVTYFLGLLSFSSSLLFMLLAIGLGMLLSVSALLLEELSFRTYPKTRHLLLLFVAAIAENFGYRQLNSYWRLEGLVKWMIRRKPKWGEMKRTAEWQAEKQTEQISRQGFAK